MKNPSVSVSVIIPCYKCQATLCRALASIEKQSVQPNEIIVVDDGNALEVRQQLVTICTESSLSNKIFRIHLASRSGPSAARNAGWNKASNEFIAFLDADDDWHPKKLEIQYRFMMSHPNISISAHQRKKRKSQNQIASLINRTTSRQVTFSRKLIINEFSTSTVMLKKSIPIRFDSDKMYSEDYLLWLEILRNGYKGAHIPMPLAYTYKSFYGEGGLSGDLWKMEKGEIDTYLKLYKKRYIPFLIFNFLLILSIAKYFRRFVVNKLTLNRY